MSSDKLGTSGISGIRSRFRQELTAIRPGNLASEPLCRTPGTHQKASRFRRLHFRSHSSSCITKQALYRLPCCPFGWSLQVASTLAWQSQFLSAHPETHTSAIAKIIRHAPLVQPRRCAGLSTPSHAQSKRQTDHRREDRQLKLPFRKCPITQHSVM